MLVISSNLSTGKADNISCLRHRHIHQQGVGAMETETQEREDRGRYHGNGAGGQQPVFPVAERVLLGRHARTYSGV